MNTKLYVDNLDSTTSEKDLIGLFSSYGNVADVNIAVDRTSHKPRGFGFVTMATPEGARSAIQGLNGKVIGSCTLTVGQAQPSDRSAASPNGRQKPRWLLNHPNRTVS